MPALLTAAIATAPGDTNAHFALMTAVRITLPIVPAVTSAAVAGHTCVCVTCVPATPTRCVPSMPTTQTPRHPCRRHHAAIVANAMTETNTTNDTSVALTLAIAIDDIVATVGIVDAFATSAAIAAIVVFFGASTSAATLARIFMVGYIANAGSSDMRKKILMIRWLLLWLHTC